MTSNEPDREHPEGFNWSKYEDEVADVANVVDLDAARDRRNRTDDSADLDDDTGPVLVDSPQAQRTPKLDRRGAQRRPLLPAWLRSRAELRDVVMWAAGYAAHVTAYHALRLPKYAGKLALRAPVGLFRTLGGAFRWLFDLEAEPVRQATVRTENAEQYLHLSRQRDRRVRWRGIVALVVFIAVVIGGIGLALAPSWVRWATLAAAVVVFGLAGAPADRPLIDRAVVGTQVAKLTSDIVVRALGVLGVAGINQAIAKQGDRAISFPAPITRDGPGWRADVDLPPGVTIGEVMDRRDKLASGLGRPLGCVWPEGNADISPSRLVLWVGDQPMAAARQVAWPLLKASTVDMAKPFPFGTDPRGRTVDMELPYTNLLIGSIPGYGKTAAIQLPMLVAALDPHAEVWAYELKGTGGLDPLAKVCARYGSGADDDTVEAALLALRDLRAECQKRAALIKGLPKDVCPDNKVTPDLARRVKGLHWLVTGLDECQELFSHPEFGKEAGELAEKIIKLGRALGVILLLATQRPDAKSLPTGVSANVGTRYCLRVMGQLENDMVLGTSAYRNGIRATMFAKKDKGVGYLVGAADEAQIVRTFYLDGPTVEKLAARAYAARQTAGTLTGHAAGQTTEAPSARRETLLEDLLGLFRADEPKLWAETLVERLTALRPEVYADLTRDQLGAALKPYGITTTQVWGTDPVTGKGANRRGIDRTAVADAVAERNRRKDDSAA
ncbi:FtsK/SpoIIIE domain-containing protein [Dactylosporangium fulvum]|uniref:Cell division protein FtsK n=1 Tax=Dactylosporangium fulvum TaxID=53359 RepID=A0ABY5VWW2_9ACTN|nr:cell division protein FtsK [Dactylosporangium fulvum]UWP80953.1 cell division protein FtsK [Dactylosporangium fulvum]